MRGTDSSHKSVKHVSPIKEVVHFFVRKENEYNTGFKKALGHEVRFMVLHNWTTSLTQMLKASNVAEIMTMSLNYVMFHVYLCFLASLDIVTTVFPKLKNVESGKHAMPE